MYLLYNISSAKWRSYYSAHTPIIQASEVNLKKSRKTLKPGYGSLLKQAILFQDQAILLSNPVLKENSDEDKKKTL